MNKNITLSNFSIVTPIFGKYPIVWIGAASFEDRCKASLEVLIKNNVNISNLIVLDYPTRIQPEREGELKKDHNRKKIINYTNENKQLYKIPSYRFGAFLGILTDLYNMYKNGCNRIQYVFDITCLTKIHTLALAYWLTITPELQDVLIVYSRPQDYRSPIKKVWDKGAWLEVIVAPFDINPSPRATGVAGIASLGHEGDRLRLALHEVPLDEGIIIFGVSDDRRLDFTAETQNQWLVDDINRQKEPRQINLIRVPLLDMIRIKNIVMTISDNAQSKGLRLVLYPFGPKPIIFGISIFALTNYLLGTWYTYPIPRTYDLDYTSGIGNIYWSTLNKK